MYKITCELHQLTPMIHFQSTEIGACLRSSEVKPKLDKFIRSNVDVPKDWYIYVNKAEKMGIYALNYKLRFKAMDRAKSINEVDNKFYQGKNKSIMYNKPIEMTVMCFIPELLQCIKEYIEIFFVLHNFGGRQGRGFGSFIISNINGEAIEWRNKNYVDEIKNLVPCGLYYKYVDDATGQDTINNIYSIFEFMKNKWKLVTQSVSTTDNYNRNNKKNNLVKVKNNVKIPPLLWTIAGCYLLAIPKMEIQDDIFKHKLKFAGRIDPQNDQESSFELIDFLGVFCDAFDNAVSINGGIVRLNGIKKSKFYLTEMIKFNMLQEVN